MFDVYALGTNFTQPDLTSIGGGTVAGVDIDILFLPVPVPTAFGLGANAFICPRIRANGSVTIAGIWACATSGGTYHQVGAQDPWSAGGTIDASILATTGDDRSEQATLGTFTSLNDDDLLSVVVDLTGDDGSYDDGVQLCAIEQELMLVRSISVSGSVWQLNGVTRGQFGTDIVAHGGGSPIIIFARADCAASTTTLVRPGNTFYVKTSPGNVDKQVNISMVSAATCVVGANFLAELNLTSPNGGEAVTHSSTWTIMWTSISFTGNVHIEYSGDDGATWSDIDASTADTGAYAWSTPAGTTSTARVRISAVADSNIEDASNHAFAVV